jgi:hypothetical protein
LTNASALDEAVRRFPYWLHQWRHRAITATELFAVVPRIISEYRLVMEERAKIPKTLVRKYGKR